MQIDVTEASEPHRALTRSIHVENEASKEWEVSVRDGNGTTVYQYAYKRFNPAQGSQRMNVTDAQGAIVAVIEYVSRAELRVYTCTDSVSPLVTGVEGDNATNTSAPQPAPSPGPAAPAFLQSRAEPAEPSPDAKPKGPQFKGPCEKPLETARLTQTWGDSASHAWTLQRFHDARHPTPSPAQLRPQQGSRFTEVEAGSRALAGASAAARVFSGGSYDVLLLLELSALVSHSEAPWCLAVTSAYVVITASVVLLCGVAVVQFLSRPRPPRRRRKKKQHQRTTTRKRRPANGAASSASSGRPHPAASAAGAGGGGAKKSR